MVGTSGAWVGGRTGGVAAMTATEILERIVTRRPNSYVPTSTLALLRDRDPQRHNHDQALNGAMHWGKGILLGAMRGLKIQGGLRGPVGSFMFSNLRWGNGQTPENATGVGTATWAWPVDEQATHLLHKEICAFIIGKVADCLMPGPPGVPAERRPCRTR